MGIITVADFEKVVEVFGFDHPVCTAVWNTMATNPDNSDEFETIFWRKEHGFYKYQHMTLEEMLLLYSCGCAARIENGRVMEILSGEVE